MVKDAVVYIAQEAKIKGGVAQVDYSPAMEYGRIEILAPRGFMPVHYAELRDILKEKLRDYHPAYDYLVLSGDVGISALIVSIVVTENIQDPLANGFNLLVWDKRAGKYFPRRISWR